MKAALWEADRGKQSLKDHFEERNKGEERVQRPILKSLEFRGRSEWGSKNGME